ncbi:hypothetical protein [Terribacillus aidingensis]|uniref:hypothetical protein n=1 Tax=Terribacillus aidingensis TaxID=586416 RepID=UPI003450A20F
MKKLLLALPHLLVFLAACGLQYDPEIEQVIELENEHLSDQGDDMNLTRDTSDIYIYADGGYVEIRYDNSAGHEQQAVYEETGTDTYERHDGMPEEAENLKREYEEEYR